MSSVLMADTDQNPQKTQDNHQKIKYLYFHYNHNNIHNNSNSSTVFLNKVPSSPSVCTATQHQQTVMSSSTSPWYLLSTTAGDNNDSSFWDGPPLTPTNKSSSSPSLSGDSSNTNQQPYENCGHFFVKRTFHKPTYCHHCVELLWGLIGQGYYCEGKYHTKL